MKQESSDRPCRRFVERLYGEVWAHLVACFRGRGLSNHDAEDKAQDTLVSLLEGRPRVSWSDPEVLRRQLLRISKHAAIDHFRGAARSQRLIAREYGLKEEGEASPPCSALEADQMLDSLAPAQREVVTRHVFLGQTAHEIAAAMGISPNTASSRLRLALKALSGIVAAALAMLVNLHELLRRRGRPSYTSPRCSLAAGAFAVLVLGLVTAPAPTIEATNVEMEGGTFRGLGEILRGLAAPPPKPPERTEEEQVVRHSAPLRAHTKTPVSPVGVLVPSSSNQERELIDRAYRHLRSHPDAAAAALDAHENAFAKGRLVAEREALRQMLTQAEAEKQRVDE